MGNRRDHNHKCDTVSYIYTSCVYTSYKHLYTYRGHVHISYTHQQRDDKYKVEHYISYTHQQRDDKYKVEHYNVDKELVARVASIQQVYMNMDQYYTWDMH